MTNVALAGYHCRSLLTELLASPPSAVRTVVFMGTPTAAVPSLQRLVEAGYDVTSVVSQPDRRRGRGGKMIASPVKRAALDLGLTVGEDPAVVLDLKPDLAVVVAYGRLIPVELLVRVPMVNVHFSLLPRWRGAAPVERAILAGDKATGVAVMALAKALDQGDIYRQVSVPISQDISALELTRHLAELGADLLIEVLDGGLDEPTAQEGTPTYASKLTRSETELDFGRPALDLHRRVRVGRAWTMFRDRRLGVERSGVVTGSEPAGVIAQRPDGSWVVGTRSGLLQIDEVKPEGKRAMKTSDWVNGARVKAGEQLG